MGAAQQTRTAPPPAARPLAATATPAPVVAPRLVASISSVPTAIQPKCAACEKKEREEAAVQPRLEVGPVNDVYEREADSVAARVMAMRPGDASDAGPLAREAEGPRACSCGKDPDDHVTPRRLVAVTNVQRASTDAALAEKLKDDTEIPRMRPGAEREGGPETVEASAADLTSGGQDLPQATRSYFETRMGRELSSVRLHQGPAARDLNQSISARAFAYRNHIWLGAGESAAPGFTMAHELAHVLQQTDPGPLKAKEAVRPRRRPIPASSAGPPKVRRNFWQPLGSSNIVGGGGALGRHDKLGKDLQSAIVTKNPDIITEVRIPGATANNRYPPAIGYADLYKSSNGNVPGLEVSADAPNPAPGPAVPPAFRNIRWSGNASKTWFSHPQLPKNLDYDTRAFPQVASGTSGSIIHCGLAPTDIKLGDVKPGHNESEREAGTSQVTRYMTGLRDTAALVNAPTAKPGCWSPNPGFLGETDVAIPADYDPGRAGAWPINELEFRQNRLGKDRVFRPFGAASKVGAGLERIRGRVSATKDPKNQGIWVYFVEPNPEDLKAALKRSSSGRSGFRTVAKDLDRIIGCLKSTPATSAKLCKRPMPAAEVKPALPPRDDRGRERPPMTRQASSATPPRARLAATVQRKTKPPEDKFDLAAWNAMRVGAGKGSSDSLKHDLSKNFTQKQRDTLAFQAAVIEGKPKFDASLGSKNSFKLPAGATDKGEGSLLADAHLIARAEFWTGTPSAIFGQLRKRLGGVFGKAYEIYEKYSAKAKGLFKGTKFKGSGKGAVAIAALKAATKVLVIMGKIVLERVGEVVLACLEKGFPSFIQKQIEGTSVEELVESAKAAEAYVLHIKDEIFGDLEAMATAAIGPLKDKLATISEAASLIGSIVSAGTTIAQGLRVGLCLAGLPEAGVGAIITCALSAGDFILSQFGLSPLDALASRMLQSCESRKLMAKAMMSFEDIRALPTTIGKSVIGFLRDVLPPQVRDIFCNPDELSIPPLEEKEIDCGSEGSDAEGESSGDKETAGDPGAPTQAPGGTKAEPGDTSGKKAAGQADTAASGSGAANPGSGASGPKKPTGQTTTEAKRVTDGDPKVGTAIIESGINLNGSYDGTLVDVTVTINIGDHVFRKAPCKIFVIGFVNTSEGRKVNAYFPATIPLAFEVTYPDGSFYRWSPDSGPGHAVNMSIRGVN